MIQFTIDYHNIKILGVSIPPLFLAIFSADVKSLTGREKSNAWTEEFIADN